MIGELIGAGASLLGGIFGNKSAKKQAKQNIRAQQAENKRVSDLEYKRQKEFAQSGIQWKAADAKRAGIHPLYALGANTTSYSANVGGGPVNVSEPSTDFQFLGDAGQNIGRAIDATRSNTSKLDAFTQTFQGLQLQSLQLDNDIKRAELASKIATTIPTGPMPGLPSPATAWAIDGQPPSGEVEYTRKIDPMTPGAPHAAYGAMPEVVFTKTPSGGYAPQVPQSLSESFEQDWPGFYQWMLRNKINPDIDKFPIPRRPLQEWKYDNFTGEYSSHRDRNPYRESFRDKFQWR